MRTLLELVSYNRLAQGNGCARRADSDTNNKEVKIKKCVRTLYLEKSKEITREKFSILLLKLPKIKLSIEE